MVKKTKQLPTLTEVKKNCQFYWKDTFEAIQIDCADAQGEYKKAFQKNRLMLKKHIATLKVLEKKIQKLQADFEAKQTKTLERQVVTAKQKMKKMQQAVQPLEKQINQLQKKMIQLNAFQVEQKAKIAACRAFKFQSTEQAAAPTVAAAKKPKQKTAKSIQQKQRQEQEQAQKQGKKQGQGQEPESLETVELPILSVGDTAPDFSAITDMNQTVHLKDFQGKSVVLYFYPKDDTPGCTQQAKDFTDFIDQFTAKGAVVLGVSRDQLTAHQRFKEKHQLNVTLLADTEESLCQRYGVIKDKIMYGKPAKGIERSTFLINPKGKIQRIWRKVSVQGHVDKVLEALDA